MKFSQTTTLLLTATCAWTASVSGQNMSQEDFREILEPYVGAWTGEYRIYSQKDELLNRFTVNRTYWWENEILLSRVVYDFGQQSQTFFHRIVLSEGHPYSFITDELASGSVRSALKGETLRGTLVWTRVLPKESLPVRISERISNRDGSRFLEFWGDQEARDTNGAAMLVRIDGFMTQLSGAQSSPTETHATPTPGMLSGTHSTTIEPPTPHQQALMDREAAENTRKGEQDRKEQEAQSREQERRLAAERKSQEEADRKAAAEQKKEEEQKKREERRAEKLRLEEERKAKEIQEKKEAEERRAAEALAKEEAAKAAAAKKEEEKRLREEARKAEAQKKKEEEQARLDARKAERERKAAEKAARKEAAQRAEPTDAPSAEIPTSNPIFNAELQSELETLKIIGVRDKPGQECIVVEHYLLFKLGEPLNLQHACTLTKVDATHLHFTDDTGYVYSIPRPDLIQQEGPEAHQGEANPQ